MRILFIAHRLPYPPNKGDKIRSFRELEALARRHEVDLFCFYDQFEDSQYFPFVRQYCRDFYAEKISWWRSRAQASLASAAGMPFTTGFYHSPKMAERLRKARANRKYDLIFVFSSSMAPYVVSASETRVLDMVDVDSNKWNQYAAYTHPPASWLWGAEGRRLAKFESRWAREFSLTLLSTSAESDRLRRNAPGANIEELENRMDMSYFDPNAVVVPPEIAALQPYIVFTGSMDYFPNVDAARFFYWEVFRAVRVLLPRARFVIAGRNPTRAVRQLESDPAVLVTGAVPDIRPYLCGACAAVAPLRVASGVQTKIFEAMAMGVPVVISSTVAKGMPECLLSEVFVEDHPGRLTALLVQKLRSGAAASRTTARPRLIEYYNSLRWEDQLESKLRRALASRNHIEHTSAIDAPDIRCETRQGISADRYCSRSNAATLGASGDDN